LLMSGEPFLFPLTIRIKDTLIFPQPHTRTAVTATPVRTSTIAITITAMDHSHMGHGGMDMGPADRCNMNMLFTWDTTNLCIVFRQWHIRGTGSLVLSLLAIVAITAGYEALRAAARRYDERTTRHPDALPRRNSNPDHSFSSGAGAAGGSQQVRLVKSALYGLQNFYAFMIMLLFMTYNGWVMISVAVGAGVGYWFFGSSGQDGVKGYKETACH